MLSEKGQTLLELVVVISVIIFVIGALTFATIASLRSANFSKNQAQATKLAQEGIERVRTGRDRNEAINNFNSVVSWNGDGTANSSFWEYRIYLDCENTLAQDCYFRIGSSGVLSFLIPSSTFPTSGTESPPDNPMFQRAVIISDDSSTFQIQKSVTVIVVWNDVSGAHESRLTTILRKI